MNFTKEQSEYLAEFDFKEGLPKNSTKQLLTKLSAELPVGFLPPGRPKRKKLDFKKSHEKFCEETFGIKHDSDKPRFDLLPADALEEVAKIYAVGAKKYGDRNWEKGLSYGRLFGAMMRHAWGWWKGERDDEENKLHHLSSVIFCALGLLHYELNSEKFKKFDDRNKQMRNCVKCNRCIQDEPPNITICRECYNFELIECIGKIEIKPTPKPSSWSYICLLFRKIKGLTNE